MKQLLIIFLALSFNPLSFAKGDENLKFILEHLQIEPEIPFLNERIHNPGILFEIYEANDFTLFWKDETKLKDAVRMLENAYEDGLIPSDYHVNTLIEL